MSRLAIVFARTRENTKSPPAPCGSLDGLLSAAKSRRFNAGERHGIPGQPDSGDAIGRLSRNLRVGAEDGGRLECA